MYKYYIFRLLVSRQVFNVSPGKVPEGCLSHFCTGLRSEQTRQSFKEDVLVLRIHGIIDVQLQGEGGVTRC